MLHIIASWVSPEATVAQAARTVWRTTPCYFDCTDEHPCPVCDLDNALVAYEMRKRTHWWYHIGMFLTSFRHFLWRKTVMVDQSPEAVAYSQAVQARNTLVEQVHTQESALAQAQAAVVSAQAILDQARANYPALDSSVASAQAALLAAALGGVIVETL